MHVLTREKENNEFTWNEEELRQLIAHGETTAVELLAPQNCCFEEAEKVLIGMIFYVFVLLYSLGYNHRHGKR